MDIEIGELQLVLVGHVRGVVTSNPTPAQPKWGDTYTLSGGVVARNRTIFRLPGLH